MKLHKAALQIETKPDKNTMNKFGKQLTKIVEDAINKPFSTGAKVFKTIGIGLKKGIGGAISGAFKMSGSVSNFFGQIVEQTKKGLEEVYKSVDKATQIKDIADTTGMTIEQTGFFDIMASKMGESLDSMAESMLKFQGARNEGKLGQYGISQDQLGGKDANELDQFLSFMDILGKSENLQARNKVARDVFGEKKILNKIGQFSEGDLQGIINSTQKTYNKGIGKTIRKDVAKGDELDILKNVIERKGEYERLHEMGKVSKSSFSGIIKSEDDIRLQSMANIEGKLETLKKTMETQAEIQKSIQKVLDIIMPVVKLIAEGIGKLVDLVSGLISWWKKTMPRWLGGS